MTTRMRIGTLALVLSSAAAWAQTPRLRDEVITGQEVASFQEFQTTALRIAGESRIPQETAGRILQDFAAANNRRIVSPAEWRYALQGGLYAAGVPYDRATSFISALGRELPLGVDTGFLAAVRTTDLKDVTVRRISREEGVRPPIPVTQPLPLYTDGARAAGIQGIVLLRCVVLEDGTPTNFKVVRPLGFGLDESAVLTIQERWKFKPATYGGMPVPVEANIEVNMRLY